MLTFRPSLHLFAMDCSLCTMTFEFVRYIFYSQYPVNLNQKMYYTELEALLLLLRIVLSRVSAPAVLCCGAYIAALLCSAPAAAIT